MPNAQRPTFQCRVCGATEISGNYEAQEMMLGLRTGFHYAQCAECMSLCLLDPPDDLSDYYARGYYRIKMLGRLTRRLKMQLRMKRDEAYFNRGTAFGKLLARYFEDAPLAEVSRLGLSRDARVLDVGCGTGKLLQQMAALGFENLTGVDPFLSAELCNPKQAAIRKCRLEDLGGQKFDVIMFHHSLEHVSDPRATLALAAQLLSSGGKCLVRLPVVARAWEQYRTNWVQLDAPRHMWIPTERAMRALADSVGFRIEQVIYDSTEFQFLGSELYSKGKSLKEVGGSNLGAYFSSAKVKEFRKSAAELNAIGAGDSAAFFLAAT